MLRSTERILVSHAGVLPRPEGLQRLFDAGPRERQSFEAALPAAVADVVARQVAAGVDIVNDGEVSKRGLFIGYIRDRMSGFEERTVPASEFRPRNAGVTGRDSRDFPGFYAAGLGGFPGRRLVVPGQGAAPVTEYVCAGPLRYTGAADARADIDRLASAAVAHGVDAFLPAITPGTVEHWLLNEHYPDDESFLAAIADVLHEEYKAITDAGLLLQVDDPDLPDGWQMFPDMTVRRVPAVRGAAGRGAEPRPAGHPARAGAAARLLGQPPRPAPGRHPAARHRRPRAVGPGGVLLHRGGQPPARARVGRLGGREAAGRRDADARRGRARHGHHRAPGACRPAADPLRAARRRART